ncbi:alpha/beta hydrolase [Melaminivora jejuensis]|uniref:alpha/beta hydrolase n=1 Tax=Melaminivora jejuensis TaxID=1267217 RepID=UPI001AE043E4|nr:alpha/beta hydrolase [Melaminivora jejuensis]UHJ64796.1 alpha/beta hydrolase [Melaminivora jejuensis]
MVAQLSTLNGQAGTELAVYDWPLPASQRRASAVLVHGLGEHMGRYEALARQLNAWGLGVRGYDHQGHGRSGGARGALAHGDGLTADLALVIDSQRAQMPPGEPLVLLGHSMGGLVAADFVARGLRPVDALVLSSPALAAFLNPLQRLLLATLPRLLPNLRVGNGLDARGLSHDAAVVAAYRADALCHDRISARLAHYIATRGHQVLAAAPAWSVPTLLLWGEDDRIIDPAGCRALAAAAPAGVLTAHGFAGLLHEIFNERDAAPVLAALRQWLDGQLAK